MKLGHYYTNNANFSVIFKKKNANFNEISFLKKSNQVDVWIATNLIYQLFLGREYLKIYLYKNYNFFLLYS
jgi:hypothetical protein